MNLYSLIGYQVLTNCIIFLGSLLIVFVFFNRILPLVLSNSEKRFLIQNAYSYSKGKYSAIIIVKKYAKDEIIMFINGFKFLLKYLMNTNQQYKVFIWPSKKEFIEIIKDLNANKLYIFGHGRHYRIDFGKNEYINYKEFTGFPHKDFVGQYHCNHGGGNSLAYFLNAKKSDVNNSKRLNISNYIKFYKWFKKSKSPKI